MAEVKLPEDVDKFSGRISFVHRRSLVETALFRGKHTHEILTCTIDCCIDALRLPPIAGQGNQRKASSSLHQVKR